MNDKIKKDKKLVSMVFSEHLHSQLKDEAERQGMSVSTLVRRILIMYLSAKNKD